MNNKFLYKEYHCKNDNVACCCIELIEENNDYDYTYVREYENKVTMCYSKKGDLIHIYWVENQGEKGNGKKTIEDFLNEYKTYECILETFFNLVDYYKCLGFNVINIIDEVCFIMERDGV